MRTPRQVARIGRGARAVVLAATVVAMTAGLAPATAQAAARTPQKPTAVRVTGNSSTGFTVVAAPSRYAKGYRVFTSSRHGYLAIANIAKMPRTAVVTKPRIPVRVGYTNKPVYYRLQAINGGKVRYSDIMVTNLRPDQPAALRVYARGTTGLALAWGGRPASRYVVTQATNPTLTAGVRRYSVTTAGRSFTPYDLRRGTRYWFSVRGYGGSVGSAPSATVSAVAPSSGLNVRVMTYNLLHSDRDGQRVGSERIAPWVSQRRTAAMALINKANPDVLALQEASDWVGRVKGPRRVDDLRARLGRYSLAHTEITPGQRGWMRTGRYLLYRTDKFRAVGSGGHWTIGTNRFAAYQLLQSRTTGAKFLAVSAHLESTAGRAADLRRKAEAERLLADVRAFRAKHDVPVVYLGDFNSHEGHAIDGPAVAFRAAGVVDADEVAQVRVNRQYNSANQYSRVPKTGGYDTDHIYVPGGVAVRRWEIVLSLSRGRFVGPIPSDHNPVAADVVLPY